MAKQSDTQKIPAPTIHYHAIVVGLAFRDLEVINHEVLVQFLDKLVKDIGMQILIPPKVQLGTFGWTGLAGIVTSHIAFHFYLNPRQLHLDVYSCREFDNTKLMRSIDDFWDIPEAELVFLKRDQGPKIERFHWAQGALRHLTIK
jgi:S-adenosylmethionine decarboxylase